MVTPPLGVTGGCRRRTSVQATAPASITREPPSLRGATGPLLPARHAAPVELDPVMRHAEPALRGHATAQRAGVRLGERPLHVHDAPARETREVMVLAGVPIKAR